MIEVTVYANAVLIGQSKLFAADPAMGVAAGLFEPVPAYDALKDIVAQWSGLPLQSDLSGMEGERISEAHRSIAFSVFETSEVLVECAFAEVHDLIDELQDDVARTLTVYGIPHKAYRRYFGQDPAYGAYYPEPPV